MSAIYKLYPQVLYTRGDKAYDKDDNEVAYDKAAVQAYVDAHAYIAKRAAAYPPLTDQFDMQYWDAKNGTTTWLDAIAMVKAKYPKEKQGS
jgi:hypothetical protein